MLIIGFESLNLDHKARQLEEVQLVFNHSRSMAIQYLVEDLIHQIVVGIVQHVTKVCLDDFDELPILFFHEFYLNQLILGLNLIVFLRFMHLSLHFGPLVLAKVCDVDVSLVDVGKNNLCSIRSLYTQLRPKFRWPCASQELPNILDFFLFLIYFTLGCLFLLFCHKD